MIRIRPIKHGDRPWVIRRLTDAFGDTTVARKGVLIDASVLPGFMAIQDGRPVGLLTYYAADGECEVVAIISVEEGRGIGRALMDAVRDHAVAAGYRRIPPPLARHHQRQHEGPPLLPAVGHGPLRLLPPRRAPLEEGQALAPGTGS